MTRVLFVSPNLQAGGAERHWSLLVPRLVQLGLDAQVLTLDGRGAFYDALSNSGVPISTVAGSRWRSAAGLRTIIGRRADVIVSRATSADALSLVASRVQADLRWVVNWHHPSGMSINARRRAILRHALPRADQIIAVCSSQVEHLEELGARSETITVIANGTDFTPQDEARVEARGELGLGDSEVAVLHVGRLETQKRVDRFIEVVKRAQITAPNIVGLIVGAGPREAELRRDIERSRARIRLLGRRDDIPRVLAAADVVCLMSDFEALPFVVLEAMASRRPVLATSVGGLSDVVVSSETGILFEPGDLAGASAALARLALDADMRRAMGSAGHMRQQRLYTAGRMSEQYASALIGPMTPVRDRRPEPTGSAASVSR